MTTQVLITTKMGIALASDSTLTVTLGDASGARKTLNNSRKIHELGSQHRVLALSSGSAYLNGIPIELFVLRWSKTLHEPLRTIEDYAKSFVAWLARNSTGKNRPDEDAIDYAASRLLAKIDEQLDFGIRLDPEFFEMPQVWEAEFNDWFVSNPSKAKAFSKALKSAADSVLNSLDDLWAYPFFDESTALKVLNSKMAMRIVDEWFVSKAMPPSIRQKVAAAMPLSLRRRISTREPQTKLVFAGYGNDSFTPQVVTVVLEGALPEMVLGWQNDLVYDGIDGATIYFPGQNRAIRTFLKGFDPTLLEEHGDLLQQALLKARSSQDVPSEVRYQLQDLEENFELKRFISRGLEDYLSEFGEGTNAKLLDTIGAMDLTAVAEVAESLTGLEVLAAHNAESPPTSGGIIEVVTIDLQYGIQWHRRIPLTRAGIN
jgi:hypothetical protein